MPSCIHISNLTYTLLSLTPVNTIDVTGKNYTEVDGLLIR